MPWLFYLRLLLLFLYMYIVGYLRKPQMCKRIVIGGLSRHCEPRFSQDVIASLRSSPSSLRGPRKWPVAISQDVIASTRRVRGNLSFSLPHSHPYGFQIPEIATSGQKPSLLAMTWWGRAGPSQRIVQGRPFGNRHCEPRFSQGVVARVTVVAHGSVIARATQVARGNLRGPTPILSRGVIARPRRGRGNLSFALPHSRSYGPQVSEIATSEQKAFFLAMTWWGRVGPSQ